MPWTVDLYPDRDLVVQRAWGSLGLSDLAELRAARRAKGLDRPAAYCLFDMRGAKLAFGLEEFREHESRVGAGDLGGRRMAIVMDGAVPTAMALAWCRLMLGVVSAQVFSTPEAACDWLGIAYDPRDLER